MLLDDSLHLAAQARKAGIEVRLEVAPEMIHVWHAFYQMLPEGEAAIVNIGDYLSSRWDVVDR